MNYPAEPNAFKDGPQPILAMAPSRRDGVMNALREAFPPIHDDVFVALIARLELTAATGRPLRP